MESAAVVTPPYAAGPLRLAPFRAIRLAPARVGDPASARALARPYRDVAKRLRQWEERGQLVRDAEPALYLHEYTASGITVRALVGTVDVSRRATGTTPRAILPHEGIYPAQADDLADRMEQMQVNPAPILLVQHSPAPLRALLAQVRADAPADHQFTDRVDHAHRIWAITDDQVLCRVDELLGPTSAVIADGHHRYAAYLRLQQRAPGGPADRGLAMVVDQDDTPLFLGAIHRVLVGTSVRDVASAAASLGISAWPAAPDDAVAALGPGHLVATDGESWLVVRVEPAGDQVEVEVLHDALVPALGHGPTRISYHHSVTDTLEHVTPRHGTAVLLPAPTVDQVQGVVEAGRLFPEKATSFQPKPAFGAFIRSWRDEPPAPS
ncbi:DUF1015 domain-containing protein [Nocardioides marinquilinus]|uniref:DUF1015 domain-containing protein n=1 Tax=Nocardioides marinquilinus TaxID=1210400 RepID=A0ABP9Q544_9ACTN